MSDYQPAPDELRDAYINESTSFPGPDENRVETYEESDGAISYRPAHGGPYDVNDNLGPSIVEHPRCRSEIEENWEQIENQLNYWQDMDNQYWIQRKEQEYKAYLERKIGAFFKQIDKDLEEDLKAIKQIESDLKEAKNE